VCCWVVLCGVIGRSGRVLRLITIPCQCRASTQLDHDYHKRSTQPHGIIYTPPWLMNTPPVHQCSCIRLLGCGLIYAAIHLGIFEGHTSVIVLKLCPNQPRPPKLTPHLPPVLIYTSSVSMHIPALLIVLKSVTHPSPCAYE
jgi:hypothetical protein